MQITIVAATNMEVQRTLDLIPQLNQQENLKIDFLISGVGLVATTYNLMNYLNNNKPDLLIQAGIAGCFNHLLDLGQVVFVKDELIADTGVIEQNDWKDCVDLGLVNPNQLPWDDGLLKNNSINPCEELGIASVKGISVNQISSTPFLIKIWSEKYQPCIETMEGAAFHYVCIQEKLKFIQLRALSNYIGERNKLKWKLKESIENLNSTLIKLISTYTNS